MLVSVPAEANRWPCWGSQWHWWSCGFAGLLPVYYESISPGLMYLRLKGASDTVAGGCSYGCLGLRGWWLPLRLSFLLIKVHTMEGAVWGWGGWFLLSSWEWRDQESHLAWPDTKVLPSATFTNFQVPEKGNCHSLAFQAVGVGSKKNIWIHIMSLTVWFCILCLIL